MSLRRSHAVNKYQCECILKLSLPLRDRHSAHDPLSRATIRRRVGGSYTPALQPPGVMSSIWNWEVAHSEPEFRYMPALIAFLGYGPLPEAKTRAEKLVRHRTAKRTSAVRLL
jgi:hypothetical protein